MVKRDLYLNKYGYISTSAVNDQRKGTDNCRFQHFLPRCFYAQSHFTTGSDHRFPFSLSGCTNMAFLAILAFYD